MSVNHKACRLKHNNYSYISNNANSYNSANSNISIENVFSYDDVLKLSRLCGYEPYFDEYTADDLIQLAAFSSDSHSLVGFISCLKPELNNTTGNIPDNNNTTIEITAMVAPDYRRQHIFIRLFQALINTINTISSNNCNKNSRNNNQNNIYNDNTNITNNINNNNSKINNINIRYIASIKDNFIDSSNAGTINIKYAYSDYLMSLHNTQEYTEPAALSSLPDTLELLKYDDEYQLVSNATDELISSVAFDIFDTHICIHDVWTAPDMRKCGYARHLLSEFIKDWKNKSNYHKLPLILHVSGTNIPAVNLYRSEGFTIAEEIKYYTLNLNNLI